MKFHSINCIRYVNRKHTLNKFPPAITNLIFKSSLNYLGCFFFKFMMTHYYVTHFYLYTILCIWKEKIEKNHQNSQLKI